MSDMPHFHDIVLLSRNWQLRTEYILLAFGHVSRLFHLLPFSQRTSDDFFHTIITDDKSKSEELTRSSNAASVSFERSRELFDAEQRRKKGGGAMNSYLAQIGYSDFSRFVAILDASTCLLSVLRVV